MIGFRIVVIACVAALAFAVFPFLFAQGPTETRLPISWEARYTTLDDDLQAVAIDPLNPSIIYMGTDKGLLVSTDRGRNWRDLANFAAKNFVMSDKEGKEALSALRFFTGAIEKDEITLQLRVDEVQQSAEEPEERGSEEVEVETPAAVEKVKAEEPTVAKVAGPVDLDRELATAVTSLQAAERELSAARSAHEAWRPDPVTLAMVDALPIIGDRLEQPYSSELGNWLEERGLPAYESATERKEALSAYLTEREREGAALAAALQGAQQAVDRDEARVASLQAEIARRAGRAGGRESANSGGQ